MTFDRIDARILDELQADARIGNAALAERVGLSPSPCLRRVRLLRERGVIEAFRTVLNRDECDLGLTVFVGVKTARHDEASTSAFVEAVLALPEVVGCHLVSGDMDFQVEVVCPDVKAYERDVLRVLLAMPAVRDIRSNFSLRCHRAAGALPVRARTA